MLFRSKANGYGHGGAEVALTVLAAGATRLAVAQVEEGLALRAALRGVGLDAPILVLSEPEPDELGPAVQAQLEPALYSIRGIEAAVAAVGRTGSPAGSLVVHLKIDTGMHRVGAAPADAVALARRIAAADQLELGSVWTHLACADGLTATGELAVETTNAQLDCYDQALAAIDQAGIEVPLRHAANSAGTLAHPRSHYDLVRCGIAVYGLAPGPGLVSALTNRPTGDRSAPASPSSAGQVSLRPALTWRSRVSFVKRLRAGEAISYGHRTTLEADTTVASIPVGYADGFRRGLWRSGGAMLINGRRRPILGVVTMDQTMVDCGHDDVAPGDEVVLIGTQGAHTITADDLAAQLGTINYEICTSIGPRVERRFRP